MTAFNVVRFRVKPGFADQFIEAHRRARTNFSGLRHASLVDTGQNTTVSSANGMACPA